MSQAAHAQTGDPRVQLQTYDPDRVVNLSISQGYAAVVELAPNEAIDNIVVGNSAVWEVTANSSGDRIIIKPQPDAQTTNMIVLTDKRRYLFVLDPFGSGGEGLFVLRFSYPEAVMPVAPPVALASYKLSGSKALFPAAMSDDGQRTRIRWPKGAPMPAVFAIGDRGKETIVNGRMAGEDYVIEAVARRFVFRLGNARAVANRKAIRVRK